MIAVALLTIKRMREPAFFIFLAIAVSLAFLFSGMDSVRQQLSDSSIFGQIVTAGRSSQEYLPAALVMFGITAFLGGFLGASEIPRDISSDLILIILSKPVRKISYMLGKFLGMLLICVSLYLVSLLVIVAAHYFSTSAFYPPQLLLKQLYLIPALLPFCAMVIMISCFTGELASMVISFFYLAFSLTFSFVPIALAMLPKGIAGAGGGGVLVLYYFFPNFIFYFQDYKMFGLVFVMLLVYSCSLSAIFLAAALGRLETMDFSKHGDL